jgi:hypothetical protein
MDVDSQSLLFVMKEEVVRWEVGWGSLRTLRMHVVVVCALEATMCSCGGGGGVGSGVLLEATMCSCGGGGGVGSGVLLGATMCSCAWCSQDLTAYKKFRNKEVASAARGLIGLFR